MTQLARWSALGVSALLASQLLPQSANAQSSVAPETPASTATSTTATPAPATSPTTPPAPAANATQPSVLARGQVSLPWHMRPAIAGNIARVDSDIAFTTAGTTAATVLSGGYAFVRNLGVYARWAMVNNVPHSGAAATALSNPLLSALYTPEIVSHVRLTVFAGASIPVGMGGGNTPDQAERVAIGAGVYTRSAMDNALFAVNYFTPTVGLGIGYMDHGLTILAECTVLELIRVRGEMLDHDETRTNFTSGLHIGYTIAQYVTPSVEFHYQRWLSTPSAVAANPALRDQATAELGIHGNIPLSSHMLARPGVAFSIPFNGNLGPNPGWALQVDLPVAFY